MTKTKPYKIFYIVYKKLQELSSLELVLLENYNLPLLFTDPKQTAPSDMSHMTWQSHMIDTDR